MIDPVASNSFTYSMDADNASVLSFRNDNDRSSLLSPHPYDTPQERVDTLPSFTRNSDLLSIKKKDPLSSSLFDGAENPVSQNNFDSRRLLNSQNYNATHSPMSLFEYPDGAQGPSSSYAPMSFRDRSDFMVAESEGNALNANSRSAPQNPSLQSATYKTTKSPFSKTPTLVSQGSYADASRNGVQSAFGQKPRSTRDVFIPERRSRSSAQGFFAYDKTGVVAQAAYVQEPLQAIPQGPGEDTFTFTSNSASSGATKSTSSVCSSASHSTRQSGLPRLQSITVSSSDQPHTLTPFDPYQQVYTPTHSLDKGQFACPLYMSLTQTPAGNRVSIGNNSEYTEFVLAFCHEQFTQELLRKGVRVDGYYLNDHGFFLVTKQGGGDVDIDGVLGGIVEASLGGLLKTQKLRIPLDDEHFLNYLQYVAESCKGWVW